MYHQEIIEKYYTTGSELHSLLMLHGQQVADKAIAIARRHPELGLDEDFLLQAGMLHDVGIFLTDAPGIHCHGNIGNCGILTLTRTVGNNCFITILLSQ